MNAPALDAGCYSLEITARITGVSVEMVQHYLEMGLIQPLPVLEGTHFDDEAVRTLRRIDHLRRTCEVNDAGLRLILHLLEEVERLRSGAR